MLSTHGATHRHSAASASCRWTAWHVRFADYGVTDCVLRSRFCFIVLLGWGLVGRSVTAPFWNVSYVSRHLLLLLFLTSALYKVENTSVGGACHQPGVPSARTKKHIEKHVHTPPTYESALSPEGGVYLLVGAEKSSILCRVNMHHSGRFLFRFVAASLPLSASIRLCSFAIYLVHVLCEYFVFSLGAQAMRR